MSQEEEENGETAGEGRGGEERGERGVVVSTYG